MDGSLLDKYPLARKAFNLHDDAYSRHGAPLPCGAKAARERVAELIDRYIDRPACLKDAMIVAAAVSLDPLACHSIYGDPAFGREAQMILKDLIAAAKTPEAALPAHLAPLVTAISIVKMEQATADAREGALPVSPAELKGSLHRGAMNDKIYLPNLHNKELQDLYETTQLIYFTALERAALKCKPPAPPPAGPVF